MESGLTPDSPPTGLKSRVGNQGFTAFTPLLKSNGFGHAMGGASSNCSGANMSYNNNTNTTSIGANSNAHLLSKNGGGSYFPKFEQSNLSSMTGGVG